MEIVAFAHRPNGAHGIKATRILGALFLAAAVSAAVPAASIQTPQSFPGQTTVPLKNGPNEVDIDGDGRQDQVFVAWRDNANAHGYDSVMFYSRGAGNDLRWQLMPFVDADFGALGDSFTTSSGADCRLRNIAILRNTAQGAPMTVIVGERDFGRSYADAAPVKFVVYRIARNADGIPGFPAVYFRADRTIASRSNHCDVNEAFLAELGIRASVE